MLKKLGSLLVKAARWCYDHDDELLAAAKVYLATRKGNK